MADLAYETLRSAFAAQPLFEDKTWQLSPQAWTLTAEQGAQLEQIGQACWEYQVALEALYLRSAQGKNLLRNRPLQAPWVAEYLDRGKPADLVRHARHGRNRGAFPLVLRPDLLLTDEGFVMTELDSVPGGIGLTAFLNRLYAGRGEDVDTSVVGARDEMLNHFYAALASLRPDMKNPLIVLVVSEEAATYRPEMEWIAAEWQKKGYRVYCLEPDDLFPLGSSLCFDVDGNPEKVDIVYRFFELFDLPQLHTAKYFFECWEAGEVVITPPMRPFQEEKLGLALFHHPQLVDFWAEMVSPASLRCLRQLIPASWIMDPAPLPPTAVLDAPKVGGRSLTDWRQLAGATQKERDLIIKVSGFHETAWGARSVVLGSDCSREEWSAGIDQALRLAPTNLHLLQQFRKPKRARHVVFDRQLQSREVEGRLRLCPYYFVHGGKPHLSGALATFCPPDKKIIHGMQDAALLPTRVASVS